MSAPQYPSHVPCPECGEYKKPIGANMCWDCKDKEMAVRHENQTKSMSLTPTPKSCENCGAPATHTGSHWEAGGMLVCYPCTVGQPFSYLESLEERDKRVRKFLDATNTQAWDGVDPDKWLETLRGHDTPETEVDL